MKLIIGLGNPGEKYEKTRHNLGFMVLERLLKDASSVKDTVWRSSDKFKSQIAEIGWNSRKRKTLEKIILAKPQTYMNNSGLAISLLANFYKISPSDIWIIYDELDLPLGTMKIRFAGASAGHHGINSIIAKLGTDKFWRFRLGIGQSRAKTEIAKHMIKEADEYVLDIFRGKENAVAKKLVKRAAKAIVDALEESIESSQNRHNTK